MVEVASSSQTNLAKQAVLRPPELHMVMTTLTPSSVRFAMPLGKISTAGSISSVSWFQVAQGMLTAIGTVNSNRFMGLFFT